MYRLLEKIPASPKKQQTLGKSIRQSGGETGRESLWKARWI